MDKMMKFSNNIDVQLTKNFSTKEFKCKCGDCKEGEISMDLVDALQQLREILGHPLTITSGFRCPLHNQAVGGSPHSTHLEGFAADIQCKQLDVLHAYIEGIYPEYSIGKYFSFIHLDTRTRFPVGRRW